MAGIPIHVSSVQRRTRIPEETPIRQVKPTLTFRKMLGTGSMALKISNAFIVVLLLYVIVQFLLINKQKKPPSDVDRTPLDLPIAETVPILEDQEVLAEVSRPLAWMVERPGKGFDEDDPHQAVFLHLGKYLGYQVSNADWLPASGNPELVWSQQLPYKIITVKFLTGISESLRLLHFPERLRGITDSEVMLSTLKADFIPPAFHLPEDLEAFREFVATHPKTQLLMTGVMNEEGVAVLSPDDVNRILAEEDTEELIQSDEDSGGINKHHFIQATVRNPLLLNQRKFDASFYVVVTSLNPTRALLYLRDWDLRMCENPYTFDPSSTDILEYICDTDTPNDPFQGVDVPVLKKMYYDLMFPRQQILHQELEVEGYTRSDVMQQIVDMVRTTLHHAGAIELEALQRDHPGSEANQNFFQYLKYDIQIDTAGAVYLMGVNYSPDMRDAKTKQITTETPQILHRLGDMLGVLGANLLFDKHESTLIPEASDSNTPLLVPEKELFVNADACSSVLCHTDCTLLYCRLCEGCISPEARRYIADAYLEHVNGGPKWSRIFPVSFKSQKHAHSWNILADSGLQRLAEMDQLLAQWFQGKCLQDYTWCF